MNMFAFDIDELDASLPIGRDAAGSMRARAVRVRSVGGYGAPEIAGKLVGVAERFEAQLEIIDKRVSGARGTVGTVRRLSLPHFLAAETVLHPGRVRRRAGRALSDLSGLLENPLNPGPAFRAWSTFTGNHIGIWPSEQRLVSWGQLHWLFNRLWTASFRAVWRIGPFHQAPPATYEFSGTGNAVVVLGGMGSSMDLDAEHRAVPVDFNTGALGYSNGDVHYFSYSDNPRSYAGADTFADSIDVQTARLAEQLREFKRQYPDRSIDLMGHSLGGAVIMRFMRTLYDPNDPTLPRIANVVTVSSPLNGAPLATIDRSDTDCPAAGAVARSGISAATGNALPPRHAPVLQDFDKVANEGKLPDGVNYTFIAGRDDVVVPADTAAPKGYSATIVNPAGLTNDHSRIVTSQAGTEAIRRGLAHQPQLEQSYGEDLRNALHPMVVHSGENTASAVISSTHCR